MSMLRFAVLLFVVLVVTLPASDVFAQAGSPQMETQVSGKDVEVGDQFVFQFSIMANAASGMPSSPELIAPSGIVIRSGPSIQTKTAVSMGGGGISHQVGIGASWTLEASRTGKYRIGPARATVDGVVYSGSVVEVQVHGKGTLPRRPGSGGRSRSNDPFDILDIFGIPRLPDPFTDPFQPSEPVLPPTDPALAMTAAPAQVVFLQALADKTSVVLGEQVTLSIYEYTQQRGLRKTFIQEPSTADFLQYQVLDPTDDPGTQYAEVGADIWTARLVRKIALFPLRVGTLPIGSMRVEYQGRGLGNSPAQGAARESPALEIVVQDAPANGRPVGYRSGDVGQFSLSAAVEPRETDAGGAVSVRVTVQGTGSLPSTLTLPTSKGMEWLDPDTTEHLEFVDGRLRGSRVFSYILKLYEPGRIDIGRIELPYYDPQRRRYSTASANLGRVTVRENQSAPPAERVVTDRFSSVDGPRTVLGSMQPRPGRVTDNPTYWIALFAMPLGVLLAGTGWNALGVAGRSVRAWRNSLDRRGRASLRAARRAKNEQDAAAEIEKATHAMIEASTGVRSRGVLRTDLKKRLGSVGASDAAADCAVSVFEACESLRFDPSANRQQVDVLLDKASELGRLLGKTRKARA